VAATAVLVLSAILRAPDATQLAQFTVLGVAAGAVYAIAASGVVLTYATTGIFNFAHGGLGMISAFAYWQLRVQWGLPAPIAVLVVLGVLAPLAGAGLELMFRGLRNADVGTGIVLTVAVTILCIGVAQYAFKSDEAHNLPALVAGRVHLFGTTVTWDDVLKVGAALAIALALRWLLVATRAGTTMRAVVDDPALAALHGASSTAVARGSWILGTELAMVAGILIGAGSNLEAITLTFFVVNAYGAAVIGRLRSLPLTFVGALALGVVQSWGSAFWFPKAPSSFFLADGEHWRRIALSLPGLFLFGALLLLPEARLAVGRQIRRAHPPVPSRARAVAGGAGLVAAVGAVATWLPAEHLGDATRALVFAVILLSMVVLTGLSGQVSLAQYVFVALGAWAMGRTFGGASVWGIVAAAAVPVVLAALVALPAMRLQGLYLALVTFGFAAVSRELIVQDRAFFGGDALHVGRPTVLGVSFAGDRAFLVLCGAAFALLGLGVHALRRGPLGRRLAAVRDSEAACATLGLDPRRTRLLAFCLAASIAGVGGALFGGSQVTVSDIPFEPINNIVLFLFAVVGGVTTVTGALVGGVLFALLPWVQSHHPNLAGLVFAGIAAVAISLGRQPDGLAGYLHGALRLRPRLWSRRRPPLLAAAAVGVIACLAVGVPVRAGAQEAADPFARFGGFEALARAGGVQASYDVKGVLPLPPPLVEVTVPNARASSSSGPSSLAFGSLAYPGDLIGNLPALVEQSAPGSGALVPPYPIATLAMYPAGPATARQDVGTASATVASGADGATAAVSLAASQVPGVVDVGTVTTTSRTGVEDGRLVARARTEVDHLTLLFGLVELDDVVTDVVAASDGRAASTGGSTTVGRATVLGQPARLGPDGPQLAGTSGPDLLGPLGAAIAQLLRGTGLRVSVAPLVPAVDGAAASVEASGVDLELDYDGSQGALAQLLALLPTDQLPGQATPGVPVNTSPQALVNLLKETHIVCLRLGPAHAQVDATPALAATDEGPGPPVDLAGSGPGAASGPGGFTTPLPALPAATVAPTAARRPLVPVPGRGVGTGLLVLAALSLPLWAVGVRRLLDGALADAAPGCAVPDGPPTLGGDPVGRRRPRR
jgi:branched-chain amino acid transport system permease protein